MRLDCNLDILLTSFPLDVDVVDDVALILSKFVPSQDEYV